MNKIPLCIVFDIDNDFFLTPTENTDALEWLGLERGLPLALNRIREWGDQFGVKPAVTLLVRADDQIASFYDSPTKLFYEVKEFSSKCENQDVTFDIGWHPHLYKKGPNSWELELSGHAQYEQIKRTYEFIDRDVGDISVTRIGECLFSNDILKALKECSISVDSTALPGRIVERTDWRNCPEEPYYPKDDDFCAPGGNGLLEVPMTVLPVQAPYETEPKLRYLNLNFGEHYLRESILENINNKKLIVTVIHPFEVFVSSGTFPQKHVLWGNGNSVFKNLCTIVESCKRIGCEIDSHLLCDIKQIW